MRRNSSCLNRLPAIIQTHFHGNRTSLVCWRRGRVGILSGGAGVHWCNCKERPAVGEFGLIVDLAMALGAAILGGAVAHRLRLPALLGYLLGGMAISFVLPST